MKWLLHWHVLVVVVIVATVVIAYASNYTFGVRMIILPIL